MCTRGFGFEIEQLAGAMHRIEPKDDPKALLPEMLEFVVRAASTPSMVVHNWVMNSFALRSLAEPALELFYAMADRRKV